VQAELGIEDSTDNLYNYLGYETGNLFSDRLLRKFCDDSPRLITWLEQYDVRFGGPVAMRKASYPPRGHYLYFSGNETTPEGKARAAPAPRGHRALPNMKTKERYSGLFIMSALKAAIAKAKNIRTMYQGAARRLVIDNTGRVVGAEIWQIPPGSLAAKLHNSAYMAGRPLAMAVLGLNKPFWRAVVRLERKYAKRKLVRVRKGVVLSAGGFINNPTMLKRHAPLYIDTFYQGTQGDDGSGIRLGASVGGKTTQMDTISAWRFVSPPYDWPKGIMVSPQGLRITNEEQYGARISRAMYEQAGGKLWLILDQELVDSGMADIETGELQDFQVMMSKAWLKKAKKADTVAKLEKLAGLPKGSLQGEVTAYNEAIAQGTTDPQGKSAAYCKPLVKAPFYALDISNQKMAPLAALTMGGLSLAEETGQVVSEAGQSIPGLYAAGRNATGMPSNEYISGMALADCIWSGWRASESAAVS